MQFTRLRLQGFKSFAEPADLDIRPGLTGVLGPNGCGKSNLVEALRWVMGETSAKRMRGGGMDDVIFAGSRYRPGRNLASVELVLDNTSRTAPPAFNDVDELTISRQIERGVGSTFRINGREVRAKDIQLMFADLATGAQATAIVRQGQIGALINAKPQERRVLLEEAAGIRGLYTRRHEATLKLKSADDNLVRLEDILKTQESQRRSLQKQARDTARYRELNEQLRQVEGRLVLLQIAAVEAEQSGLQSALSQLEAQLQEIMREAAQLSRQETEAASELPALRKAEATAAAEVQRYQIELRHLEEQDQRLEQTKAQLEAKLEEIAADRQRETAIATEARSTVERLQEEQNQKQTAQGQESEEHKELELAVAELQKVVGEAEAQMTAFSEELAEHKARRRALEEQIQSLTDRQASLTSQQQDLQQQREGLGATLSADRNISEKTEAIQTLANQLEQLSTLLQQTEEAQQDGRAKLESQREELRQFRGELDRLVSEQSGLQNLLQQPANDAMAADPVLDSLQVQQGYETALSAALGETLYASQTEEGGKFWQVLTTGNMPPLPTTATPLSQFVKAPPALARALSQIGVVDNGRGLQADLQPGQILVNAEGQVWRWDGYVDVAPQSQATAVRLQQQNRLVELEKEINRLQKIVDEKQGAVTATESQVSDIQTRLVSAREQRQDVANQLEAARQEKHVLIQRRSQQESELLALDQRLQIVAEDLAGAQQKEQDVREQLGHLASPEAAETRLEELKHVVGDKRSELMMKQSRLERFSQEVTTRRERLQSIEQDLESWQQRIMQAEERLQQLAERQQQAETQKQALLAKPEETAEKHQKLLDMVQEAEAKRRTQAQKLEEKEAQSHQVQQAVKEAEKQISALQQDKVQKQTELKHQQQEMERLAAQVVEKFSLNLTDLRQQYADEDLSASNVAEVTEALHKLQARRETMGPVNLRAEQELEELEKELEGVLSEKDDLLQAISKLRNAISTLNREGRQRLLASFEEVNQHFQKLFQQLFGGGKAHLSLVDAEDPLQAGLEVMAQPPGKRLQTLSLLSGGEQALTTVALIFSVFLTNPAPICVLDEVDAPLDDANVARFCKLLEEMSRQTDTAFVIITHHRMTMARMDRLYGVTMGEEGVSQLVSVDLQNMGHEERRRA